MPIALISRSTVQRAALREKISVIDWAAAPEDVAPFLPSRERESLKLWSAKFFDAKVRKLLAQP